MDAASSTISNEGFWLEVDSNESVWCLWLLSLPAWDRHTVFNHELEWHDNFCSGEWSFDDLTNALTDAQQERDS